MATPDLRARLDELAVLVAVSEAGSLAAAARRLALPKSTVGRAIARLEEDLGGPLVRRLANARPLTALGESIVAAATPHVQALQAVVTTAARGEAGLRGQLRVTAPVDLAEVLLAPVVLAFRAAHPAVTVEVDASPRLVDLVGEGFDLAVRVARDRLAPSSLVARRLARFALGLYASPSYLARAGRPRRAEDLTTHELVLLPSGRKRRPLVLEGPRGEVTVAASGSVAANDFLFVREMLLAGAGIGALPGFRAAPAVADGRLVRVLPELRLAGTTAFVVHPPARPLPPLVEAFKGHLLRQAPLLLVDRDRGP